MGGSTSRPAQRYRMRDMEARPISDGRVQHATSLWCEGIGTYGLREAPIPPSRDGEVRLAALWSAVSRGTERLVLEGRVPPAEAERMRCPHQDGAFPFPVKYGYALVGRVEVGPLDLVGRTAFALHPHQTHVILPREAILPVPDGVPPRRATLAANMETALNVVWDSGAGPGDRVLVLGAGVVGLMAARLLARTPGTEVTVADRDERKAAAAGAMGARFADLDRLPRGVDVVVDATGSGEALADAIDAAALEARIVVAGWLGAGTAAVPLGGAFHSLRLALVSSQVGRVPQHRAPRWTQARRLAKALELLGDAALDALFTHELALADAPRELPRLLAGDTGALAITLRY